MEGSNKCPWYDENTQTLYMPPDVQKKFDDQLHQFGYVTLRDFYEMLAEAFPEDLREEFLKNSGRPWNMDDEIGFSLDCKPGIVTFDFNINGRESESL